MSISIAQVSAEHHHSGFGLYTGTPRLSWRFNETIYQGWTQKSYDIIVIRGANEEPHHVESSDSILVSWPSSPLASREKVTIKVRSNGLDNISTDWASLTIEVALLERSDWCAKLIGGPSRGPEPKKPFRLQKTFIRQGNSEARLYATAYGVYEVKINGKLVGDQVLAPGWQSYHHRLHYQTYNITDLLEDGKNAIEVHVGEGWYCTRLGRPGVPNQWGDRPSFLGQVEIAGKVVCTTDTSWDLLQSPVLSSELYNGEVYDTNSTGSFIAVPDAALEELPFPQAQLISPEVAPIRQLMELKAKRLFTTPSGKRILDFGQNFVGWLRVERDISGNKGDELVIRHAEVMEHDELGVRPLRTARAKYTIKLGGTTRGLQSKFTFFGFRYVFTARAAFSLCSNSDQVCRNQRI